MGGQKAKLFSKDYILIMVSVMGTSFVNYFFFSTISLLSDTLTGTARFAGYMSLVYSVTALLVRPLSGFLSDRHGRVKLIILGAALCTVSCVLYNATLGLASTRFTLALVLLLLIRVLNGASMSMNQTCAGAAIPDIVPSDKLTQGVGIFGMYSTIAQAIGPFIALSIVGSGDLNGFRTLFTVAAILSAVSLFGGCFISFERKKNNLTDEQPSEAGLAKNEQKSTQEAFIGDEKVIFGLERQVIGLFFMIMLYFLGMAGVLSYLTLFAKTRGFRVEYVSIYFFVNAGGLLLSRILFGKIVDKRGADKVIIPGSILTVVCLAAIPLAPSLPFLICLGVPYGFACGAVAPTLNAVMFKRCSPKRRGAVSAAYFVAVDIGISVGTPIMGFIADYIDFAWVYWLSAVITGLSFLLYMLLGTDKRFNRKFTNPGYIASE